MRSILLNIALIVSFTLFSTGCKDDKICRCLIDSNAENRPEPLFEIIYIDEDEQCESLNSVDRVYKKDAEPNDTITNYIETTVTCSERMDSFPPEAE